MAVTLIGDVGGTKTALAIIDQDTGPRKSLAEHTYPSAEYNSLEGIIADFLQNHKFAVTNAVFGVAGPVLKGTVKTTNLPWIIDTTSLQQTFNLTTVHLINDVEAIAHAIPYLESNELHTLNQGEQCNTGNMAVIAPGTGLGEAFITWQNHQYHICSSEGGHTDFAPRNAFERNLLEYLLKRFDHISYERVCSGPGITNIYRFLRDEFYGIEPPWLTLEIASASDPTPIIVAMALKKERQCQLCIRALDTFIAIAGAEAGNLALKVMATNGIFFAGGIPNRVIPFFEKNIFMDSFSGKGRLSSFLKRIPVHIITNTKVALLGTACKTLKL